MEFLSSPIIRESTIWIGKDLEILTRMTLTSSFLQWRSVKKEYTFSVNQIIGSRIFDGPSRSFKVLVYHESPSSFRTYEFSSTTSQQAQDWCDHIIKACYPKDPRRLCIIINPICGNCTSKKVLDNELTPVLQFSPHTYDCFYTTHEGFIDELIQRRDFSVYSDVLCLGGDGTVQQCINGIYKYQPELIHKLNFGALPVGSRNALACELNGKAMENAIFNAVKGNTIIGDAMNVKVNGLEIIATCAISWGVISDACDEAQHLRVFGALRYNLVAFKKFFTKWKEYRGTITFEDSLGQMISFKSDYVFAIVSNHQVPNLQNSEIVMPKARINDGKIDLLIMFFTGKCKSLGAFWKMQNRGAHIGCKSMNFIKTRVVKIEPTNLMVFNVDGEIYYSDKIVVEVLPKFLSYIGRPLYTPRFL